MGDGVGTVRLRYYGIPAFASRLGQALRADGIDTSWDPPEERRGLQDIAEGIVEGVTVYYLCKGGDGAIEASIDKIRGWLGGRGTIDIDNVPPDVDGGRFITEGIAKLHADQAAALEEYERRRTNDTLGAARIVRYVCAGGCVLADVFSSANGTAVYRNVDNRTTASLLDEFQVGGFIQIGCEHLPPDLPPLEWGRLQWEVINRDPGASDSDVLVTGS